MEFSEKILKAINKGINEALTDLIDGEEDNSLYTSRSHSISLYAKSYKDTLIWIKENFVDLGLPSGTLWAKCNIHAMSPEEAGDYYAWGEVEPKDVYDWEHYKHAYGCEEDMKKYNGLDKKTKLDKSDDIAYLTHSVMSIPTIELFEELLSYTYNITTDINGKKGRKFISKKDEASYIFIPMSGYKNDAVTINNGWCNLWSSELPPNNGDHYDTAVFFTFSHTNSPELYAEQRYNGYNIRGVINKQDKLDFENI